MEGKHGAKAEEIERNPRKHGYTSALTETDKVRCPLLILNARDDDNSPVSIMELYVQKLKDAKKQVETYFPDKGGHGFYVGRQDGPEYRDASKRSVEFFGRQLGPIGRPSQPEPREATKPTLEQYGSLDWVDPDRYSSPMLNWPKSRNSRRPNDETS
jgi:hypothetical protein